MRGPARDEEYAAAIALRRRVFCDEQAVPEEIEIDGRDPDALHLVALAGDLVVGTCRILVEHGTAKVGRLAVERPYRRRGIASLLLRAAEARAREAGAALIVLNAQLPALDLYRHEGFDVVGDVFVEAGIDHLRMEKALA